MKTTIHFGIFIFLMSASVGYCAQTNSVPPPTPPTVIHRDANERVWEQTTYTRSHSGKTISQIHHYTELGNGICYWDGSKWLDSQEEINILPDGSAEAVNGQHQAYWPVDIYNGTVRLVTREGKTLDSRPIGLAYDDGTSTVLIGELTNSVGELVSSNQVMYPNAFVGLDADLLYTYRKSGLEQDVIFRKQPPAPKHFGFNSASTRLQLVTEFFNAPVPVQSEGAVNPRDGLQDTTLAFGTMKFNHGSAFLADARSLDKIPVYKSWVVSDGRTLLIEQLPYSRISPKLATLPSGVAMGPADSILRKVSAKRLLPPMHLAETTTKTTELAKADLKQRPGVVLDYVTIDSGQVNFTFQGDTTYYVSGDAVFSGTTTIEGGSVIKLNGNGLVEINGPIDCETTAYKPCTFTSFNDNGIGEPIWGVSSGSPNFEDVWNYLQFDPTNSVTLYDLSFRYATVAVAQWNAPASFVNLRDCQCYDVVVPVFGYEIGVYNALFGTSSDEVSAITNQGDAQIFVEGPDLIAENVTADSGYSFIEDDSGATPALTNCLVTSEPIYSPYASSPVPASQSFVWLPSPSVPVYQTVGGGNYYLATNSLYRGAGTGNIDPDLRADLAQKTTWPPVVYDATDISSLGSLIPQAPRDTNSAPDIGYHYDALDYLIGGCDLETNLFVTAGTAVGWFNDYDANYIPDAITLNDGANLTFDGTVTQPCYFTQGGMVQEVGSFDWYNDTDWASGAVTFNGSGTPSLEPELSAAFAMWTADGHQTLWRDYWASGAGVLKDCEFYNGSMSEYDMQSMDYTNCLFFRIQNDYWDQDYAISYVYENCTFYNGCLFSGRYNGLNSYFNDAGLSSSFWLIENCSFDGTAFAWTDCFNADSTNTLFDFNAYNTNNLSWQTYPYPYPPTFGTNEIVGPDDLMVPNYNWQSSWFGDFYLPPDSQLLHAGSTSAAELGLYHYTVLTNQTIEGDNTVSIGYHYVATDTNGVPLDSNHDGIPDYIEDPNGNGLVDIGETPWMPAFYVATNGSDSNPGTLAAPFHSIQAAANTMQPGDICLIQGGTYRETVRPPMSGTAANLLTFQAYSNETVTVSGCNVVTGWQTYSNSIMVASNSAPISQVFVDGRQMLEARFPNVPLGDPMLSKMDWTNISSYQDSSGVNWATVSGATRPNGYWVGCQIVGVCGTKDVSFYGVITNSVGNTVNFDNDGAPWYQGDGAGYIQGKFSELDSPGEWYQNTNADLLYLWFPPGGTTVEGRVRDFGFDLHDESYIHLVGLNFMGCSLSLSNAQCCLVNGCTDRYPRAFFSWGYGHVRGDWNGNDWVGTGIVMSGASNTIENSYVAHSWGDCISVWGTNNTVSNCVVEDAGWSGTDTAPITTTGTGHTFMNSTLRLGGRGILIHRGLANGLITSNILADCGILTEDNGLTYTFQDMTPTTEISYNWFHDNHAPNGVGIYIDNSSANKIVHHNVVWRCETAIYMNDPAADQYVYNNTTWDDFLNVAATTVTNVIVWNNIGSGFVFRGNVGSNDLESTSDLFQDSPEGNFTPRLGSPTIDSGVQIDGVPGYLGAAPDLGAYEYNAQSNYWTPGANFSAPSYPDTVPLVPANVNVRALTPYSCDVTWDPSSGAQSYFVESSLDETNWIPVATVSNGTSSVVDDSLAPGTTNFYRVTACSTVGKSISSDPTSAQTPYDGSFIQLQAAGYDNHNNMVIGWPGNNLQYCDGGDWVEYSQVPLTNGYRTLRTMVGVLDENAGQWMDVHIDSPTGEVIGTLTTTGTSTNSWFVFEEETNSLIPVAGTHDVYMVMRSGSGVGNFEWFQFENPSPVDPTNILLQVDACNSSNGVSIVGDVAENCANGDWLCFQGINFDHGYNSLQANLSVPDSNAGQAVDIRLDSPTNPVVGTLVPASTGGWTNWQQQWVQIDKVTGTHNVYVMFRGQSAVGNFEWFQFGSPLVVPPMRLEAEENDNMSGVVISNTMYNGNADVLRVPNTVIGSCNNGAWVEYKSVDLGDRYTLFRTFMSVPASNAGQAVDIHIDSPTGTVIGTLVPTSTGDWNTYAEETTTLTAVDGIHDLYIVFNGTTDVGRFDWFQLEEP